MSAFGERRQRPAPMSNQEQEQPPQPRGRCEEAGAHARSSAKPSRRATVVVQRERHHHQHDRHPAALPGEPDVGGGTPGHCLENIIHQVSAVSIGSGSGLSTARLTLTGQESPGNRPAPGAPTGRRSRRWSGPERFFSDTWPMTMRPHHAQASARPMSQVRAPPADAPRRSRRTVTNSGGPPMKGLDADPTLLAILDRVGPDRPVRAAARNVRRPSASAPLSPAAPSRGSPRATGRRRRHRRICRREHRSPACNPASAAGPLLLSGCPARFGVGRRCRRGHQLRIGLVGRDPLLSSRTTLYPAGAPDAS